MHGDDSFYSGWDLIKHKAASLDLLQSTIPRKCKEPAKYLGEQETPSTITEPKQS